MSRKLLELKIVQTMEEKEVVTDAIFYPCWRYLILIFIYLAQGAPSGQKIVATLILLHTPISDETKMVSQIAYSNF